MALLILAHPYYTQSIANKTIVNELIKTYPDLEVRDIFQLYPDYKIDVSAEQEALLRHDTIILQYPMFWFNMPAILKLWFDEVFTYQFAYGSQGNKLKDKKVIISMTVGQKEANMVNDQENLIDSFLKAVQHSIQYTQMQLS
ncbi:NAD(P)H-dependent oxidoreductase, partial [Acinetobacter baumannii]|nr:NAD(P)H-dependent oxidoreductase [Acinetobacter baumannii]